MILPQLATKNGSFVVNMMDFGLGYSGPFQITRPVFKLAQISLNLKNSTQAQTDPAQIELFWDRPTALFSVQVATHLVTSKAFQGSLQKNKPTKQETSQRQY